MELIEGGTRGYVNGGSGGGTRGATTDFGSRSGASYFRSRLVPLASTMQSAISVSSAGSSQ